MTKKVLVVDDSPTIQKFISLALADEDILVECVIDGGQALEKSRSLRPDLVLADVLMPGINGYEICSSIKNDSTLADTRVVLMVGAFESFDEEAAANVKCDAHLTKPFDTSELIELTHSMMLDHADGIKPNESEGTRELSTPPNTIGDLDKQDVPTLISPKTKESFVGSRRILEVFAEKDVLRVKSGKKPAPLIQAESISCAAGVRVMNNDQSGLVTKYAEESGVLPRGLNIQAPEEIPDEVVDQIVERVVRRMSQEVIREIAWEVVPELSDVIIRQRLEEIEKKS
jgi:CheY-like chemotaxis protein